MIKLSGLLTEGGRVLSLGNMFPLDLGDFFFDKALDWLWSFMSSGEKEIDKFYILEKENLKSYN